MTNSFQEELDVKTINQNCEQPLTIYAKFPSVGFKYITFIDYQRTTTRTKRFQVSFNSANEFQQFMAFLHDNNFNVKDDSTPSTYNQPSSQFIRPSLAQTLIDPFSQLSDSQSLMNVMPMSQPQPLQPVIQMSQPQPARQQPSFQQISSTQIVESDNEPQPQFNDYLSQILKPKSKELKDLSDEDLKKMLNEKLRDINFINFVGITSITQYCF